MQVSQYFGIAAVVVLFVYIIAKIFQGKEKKRSARPGTVVLHQFPPSELCVSGGSPPCLKLETFLRMTKIPYENEYGFNFSKKGKMPWIELLLL